MLTCGASAEQDGRVLNKRETRREKIEKVEISQRLLESFCYLQLNLNQWLDVGFKGA